MTLPSRDLYFLYESELFELEDESESLIDASAL